MNAGHRHWVKTFDLILLVYKVVTNAATSDYIQENIQTICKSSSSYCAVNVRVF